MSDERTSAEATRENLAVMLVQAGVYVPIADFVKEVREAAGFRVSPRQIEAALEGLASTGDQVTAARVAEIATALRGDRSGRQRRNTADWQTLGAILEARGQDGSGAGQRAFVDAARKVAGPKADDGLILEVALADASQSARMDPQLVGQVAKRIANRGRIYTAEDITTFLADERRRRSS